jgi:transcriptional regulator GlxA family with amidase domain
MYSLVDARIDRAICYISKNLGKRITLVEAASMACLEPFYFSKRFHKTMGVSFGTWNAQIRIEAAKKLLVESSQPITSIAAAVGYSDLTTFERAFRRLESRSPRAHRRLGQIRSAYDKTGNAETKTENAETEHPAS